MSELAIVRSLRPPRANRHAIESRDPLVWTDLCVDGEEEKRALRPSTRVGWVRTVSPSAVYGRPAMIAIWTAASSPAPTPKTVNPRMRSLSVSHESLDEPAGLRMRACARGLLSRLRILRFCGPSSRQMLMSENNRACVQSLRCRELSSAHELVQFRRCHAPVQKIKLACVAHVACGI